MKERSEQKNRERACFCHFNYTVSTASIIFQIYLSDSLRWERITKGRLLKKSKSNIFFFIELKIFVRELFLESIGFMYGEEKA